MDDLLLIKQTLNGNQQAFAALVHRYKDMAYSIALRIVKDSQDAEEVAQDAFVKAYRSLNGFKGTAKFSTWLYSIVYHAAISKARKKKRLVPLGPAEEENTPATGYDGDAMASLSADERKTFVAQAMQTLHPIDATLLNLYYFDEQPVNEIAEITKMSVSNVKVRLHRARKQLHTALHQQLQSEIRSIL